MRATNTLLATAIAILLVAPAWPTAMAAHEPSAHITSPKEGGTLHSDGTVWIHYEHGDSSANTLSGEVTLDGVKVATFSQPLKNTSTDVTFAVAIDAAALAAGARTLQATMQADNGSAAATTQAVGVVLQHPPVVKASAQHDRDNATLVVSGTATDDTGPVDLKISTPLGTLKLNASGEFSALQNGQLKVGDHSVTIQATDIDGITRSWELVVSVQDREAVFENVSWTVENGILRAHGRVSDPDNETLYVALRLEHDTRWVAVSNATFSLSSSSLRPGNYTAHLVTDDGLGGSTELAHAFEVKPVHRVLYDQEIRLEPGAHVSLADFWVPPWFEGTITICGTTRDGNCTFFPFSLAGSVQVAVAESGGAWLPRIDWPDTCGYTAAFLQVGTKRCTFQTGERGGLGHVSWDLAGVGSVRVIVEGATY